MNQSKHISAIVAMTKDRIIGKDGDIPWHYSEDLKRFKRLTVGSIIIMGRKTWESIGSKPLPRRRNIVISRTTLTDIESYNSVEDALKNVKGSVWIIGGGQIYQSAIEFCQTIDVTWIPEKVEGEGLVKFPQLHESNWIAGEIEINENDRRLSHQLFTRKG